MATLFLDRKEFTGAHGLGVTDKMAVAVAAQACLPVLRLGLQLYDGFVGIVMHRDEVVAAREVTDEAGVVHRYGELLAGEAMEGGPVMLSWRDVRRRRRVGRARLQRGDPRVRPRASTCATAPPTAAAAAAPRQPRAVARDDAARVRALLPPRRCRRTTPRSTRTAPRRSTSSSRSPRRRSSSPGAMRGEQPALYGLFADYFRQDPAAETG